ncbi:fibronectin type III domain-containing protein, partial [Acetivibrio straminisolvens]
MFALSNKAVFRVWVIILLFGLLYILCNDNNVLAQGEPTKISTENAELSAAAPTNSWQDVRSAFDGDESTVFHTAEDVDHAYVQVSFAEPKTVVEIRALIGEIGYPFITNDWWVEAADSLEDLENMTGSYRLVVDTQYDIAGEWQEVYLEQPVTRKIWRVSARKKIWDNSVGFVEIEFWGFNAEDEKIIKKINILEQINTLNAIITNTHRGGGMEINSGIDNYSYIKQCFDGVSSSFAEILEGDSAYLQIEFSNSKNINQIRIYNGIIQDQKLTIEMADSEEDLKSKSGTYYLINSQSYQITPENWIIVNVPSDFVSNKFVKFSFTKAPGANTIIIPKIELWSDDITPPSVPMNLNARPLDARTIELTWQHSSDNDKVSGYRVFRNGNYIGTSITNRFTDTLLDPQTTYNYTVCAFDAVDNESALSNTVTATTTNSMEIKTDYNVMVLYYDPIIKAGTYFTKVIPEDIKYSELYSLSLKPVNERAQEFADNIRRASGGSVNFNIVEIREINTEIPANCPEMLNSEALIEYMEFRDPNKDYDVYRLGGFNYRKAFKDNNIIELVENGDVDFVWIYTTPPNNGLSESTMVGRDAYFSNGITLSDIACSRKFLTLIGSSYECFGHHIDNGTASRIFSKLPKKTEVSVLQSADINNQSTVLRKLNDWEKFQLTDTINFEPSSVSPNYSQVGNMHFPCNAVMEYGWEYIDENFNHYDNWNIIEGTWSIYSGMFRGYSNNVAKATLKWSTGFTFNQPMVCRNMILESDIILNLGNQGSSAGVIFRATEHENSGFLFKGYYVGIDANNDKVFIAKINNGYSEIASTSMPIYLNTGYKLKVIAEGRNIKVYINNMEEPAIDIDDDSFLGSGTFGYLVKSGQASFDNLLINSIAESYADTWYNYPDLDGEPSKVTFDDWNGEQDAYQLWVFDHIPRNPGMHNAINISNNEVFEGILNNWWPYIVDFNRFDASPITYEVTGYPVPPVVKPSLHISKNSFVLSWIIPQNSGIQGCNIYRNGVKIGSSTNGIFIDDNIEPYILYNYEIKAYDSYGNESIPVNVSGSAYLNGVFTKININNASLSSAAPTNSWQDVRSAFDGDESTVFHTAEDVEHAYVQVSFEEPKTVAEIRVLIGEIGYPLIKNDWWVEAADSLEDLEKKTGSYRLVVDTQYDIAGEWQEVCLEQPVTKKIWRVSARKKIWDNSVGFVEIEFWGVESQIRKLSLDGAELSAAAPTNSSQDVRSAFDGNESTVFYTAEDLEHAYVQVSFAEPKTVTEIRALIGEIGYPLIKNDWWVEAADSLEDLENKTGSYQLVVDTQYDIAGEWQEVYLQQPVTKKIWRVSARKKMWDNSVGFVEIEFWGFESPLKKLGLDDAELSSAAPTNSWQDIRSAFDGNESTVFHTAEDVEHAYVQV